MGLLSSKAAVKATTTVIFSHSRRENLAFLELPLKGISISIISVELLVFKYSKNAIANSGIGTNQIRVSIFASLVCSKMQLVLFTMPMLSILGPSFKTLINYPS